MTPVKKRIDGWKVWDKDGDEPGMTIVLESGFKGKKLFVHEDPCFEADVRIVSDEEAKKLLNSLVEIGV